MTRNARYTRWLLISGLVLCGLMPWMGHLSATRAASPAPAAPAAAPAAPAAPAAAPAAPAAAPAKSTGPSTGSYFGRYFYTETGLGTTVVWFLLINSTILLALVIQSAMQNRVSMYMPQSLLDQVSALIQEKKYREAIELTAADPSPMGQVLNHALKQANRGYDAMEEAVFEMAENIGSERIRALVWMEVAGAAGPMMGLFGTVYGMITTFTQLVQSGGTPKAGELAGGIATSLVCTFWGLVVGIPGVISASVLRVKVEGLTTRTIWLADDVIAAFRPKPAGAAVPTGRGVSPKPSPDIAATPI